MKFLKYKNYTGSIEYSDEDDILFGRVMGIESILTYHGETGNELLLCFQETIDNYLELCEEENISAEIPKTKYMLDFIREELVNP